MAFLKQLKKSLQIESTAEFSRMCGKQQSNMTGYLSGNLSPGSKVLRDCLLNATISRIFKNPPADNTTFGKDAKRIRNDVLSSAISNLFDREIQPLGEVVFIPERQRELPEPGGVYVLYDSAANVLYIGQATSFRTEVWQTLRRNIPVEMRFGPDMRTSRPAFRKLASYMSLYRIDNARLRHNIEALFIRVFINQTHNSNVARYRVSRHGAVRAGRSTR